MWAWRAGAHDRRARRLGNTPLLRASRSGDPGPAGALYPRPTAHDARDRGQIFVNSPAFGGDLTAENRPKRPRMPPDARELGPGAVILMAPPAHFRLKSRFLLVEHSTLFEDLLDETWAARDPKSARRLAKPPPATAIASSHPNATAEFPNGAAGPHRVRESPLRRARGHRRYRIGGAALGSSGVPGP